MKELKKQYNKDVKKSANFDLDRRSYIAGGRAALGWVLKDLYRNQYGQGMDNLAQQINEELES